MQLTATLAFAAAALTTLVSAQNPFSFNTAPTITAGTPFQITWSPSTGTTDTVTLLLKQGPASQLATVLTIASHIQNLGAFAWAVPATLVKGSNYTFEIIDDGNTAIVNYSVQFSIDSTVTASSAASTAKATATASGTAASSSATATKSAAGRKEVEMTGGVLAAVVGAAIAML